MNHRIKKLWNCICALSLSIILLFPSSVLAEGDPQPSDTETKKEYSALDDATGSHNRNTGEFSKTTSVIRVQLAANGSNDYEGYLHFEVDELPQTVSSVTLSAVVANTVTTHKTLDNTHTVYAVYAYDPDSSPFSAVLWDETAAGSYTFPKNAALKDTSVTIELDPSMFSETGHYYLRITPSATGNQIQYKNAVLFFSGSGELQTAPYMDEVPDTDLGEVELDAPVSLPETVTVRWSNQSETQQSVQWDVLSPPTDEAGQKSVSGSVEGTNLRARAVYTVKEPTLSRIVYFNPVAVQGSVGAVSLPEKVEAVDESGETALVPVEWDSVPEAVGVYRVEGSVSHAANTDERTACAVVTVLPQPVQADISVSTDGENFAAKWIRIHQSAGVEGLIGVTFDSLPENRSILMRSWNNVSTTPTTHLVYLTEDFTQGGKWTNTNWAAPQPLPPQGELVGEYALTEKMLGNMMPLSYCMTPSEAALLSDGANYLRISETGKSNVRYGNVSPGSLYSPVLFYVFDLEETQPSAAIGVEEETVYYTPGHDPILPGTVTVRQADMQTVQAAVVWDTEMLDELMRLGLTVTLTGTVEGFSVPAVLTLQAPSDLFIPKTAVQTTVGKAPPLPEKVAAYQNGTHVTDVYVDWSAVSPSDYANATLDGPVEITCCVDGTDIPVQLDLYVSDPEQQPQGDLTQTDLVQNIQEGNLPYRFSFRQIEGIDMAAWAAGYETWEAQALKYDGIMGKLFDEEMQPAHQRIIHTGSEEGDYAFEWFSRYKQEHPEKLVMLHYNGRSNNPLGVLSGIREFYPGHFLYYQGTTNTQAILSAEPGELTEIEIEDIYVRNEDGSKRLDSNGNLLYRFRFWNENHALKGTPDDDIAIIGLNEDGTPNWEEVENVVLVGREILDEESGRAVITVRRGQYESEPLAFAEGEAYLAAHMCEGPWGGTEPRLSWSINFSDQCPVDPETGKQAWEVFAERTANYFRPGGMLQYFDGLEFDVAMAELTRLWDTEMAVDTNGDLREDNGIDENGVNRFAIGYEKMLGKLRELMGNDKLILADGFMNSNQRAVEHLNGMEIEDFEKYGWDWSTNINKNTYWTQYAVLPRLSYNRYLENWEDLSKRRYAFANATMAGMGHSFIGATTCDNIYDELSGGAGIERDYWLGSPLTEIVSLRRQTEDLLNGEGKPVSDSLSRRVEAVNGTVSVSGGQITAQAENGNVVFRINDIDVSGLREITVFAKMAADASEPYAPAYGRRVKVSLWDENGNPVDLGMKEQAGPFPLAPFHLSAILPTEPFDVNFHFWNLDCDTVSVEIEVEYADAVHLSEITVHAGGEVAFRQYENGLILANPQKYKSYTFDLQSLFPDTAYRRLEGTDDPEHNNGDPAVAVRLDPGDAIFLAVQEPGAPPQTPVLTEVACGTETAELSWEVPTEAPQEYVLTVMQDNGKEDARTLVFHIPAGETAFTATGLAPGTPYRFTLTALSAEGRADSEPVCAKTTGSYSDTAPGIPLPPSDAALPEGIQTLSLDTTAPYTMLRGSEYIFLLRNPKEGVEYTPAAGPGNAVEVSFAGDAPDGKLFRVRGLRSGDTWAGVTGSDQSTAWFPVSVREALVVDTQFYAMDAGDRYHVGLTWTGQEAPAFGIELSGDDCIRFEQTDSGVEVFALKEGQAELIVRVGTESLSIPFTVKHGETPHGSAVRRFLPYETAV